MCDRLGVLLPFSSPNGMVGKHVPSSVGQSGYMHLFFIHPDQDGHRLSNDILMTLIATCWPVATPLVVY